MKVWAVTADYGLNGAECLGVFATEPSREQLDTLESTPADPPRNWTPPRGVTGFGGLEAVAFDVPDAATLVRCHGHIDPAAGHFREGYSVTHELSMSQATAVLEVVSQGWSEERSCLLEAIDTQGGQS